MIYESDIDRFLAKVDQYEFVDMCWNWTGSIGNFGYGVFWYGDRNGLAHKWIYKYFFGAIPPKHVIHHTCGNKLCVNPQHLQCLSRSNHMTLHERSYMNTDKTHCKYGHEFTEANTYICKLSTRAPFRVCKECNRIRKRERRGKN